MEIIRCEQSLTKRFHSMYFVIVCTFDQLARLSFEHHSLSCHISDPVVALERVQNARQTTERWLRGRDWLMFAFSVPGDTKIDQYTLHCTKSKRWTSSIFKGTQWICQRKGRQILIRQIPEQPNLSTFSFVRCNIESVGRPSGLGRPGGRSSKFL